MDFDAPRHYYHNQFCSIDIQRETKLHIPTPSVLPFYHSNRCIQRLQHSEASDGDKASNGHTRGPSESVASTGERAWRSGSRLSAVGGCGWAAGWNESRYLDLAVGDLGDGGRHLSRDLDLTVGDLGNG